MAKEDYILKQTGEQVQKAIDDALALAPATVETPGLMSASDKEKLNGLPTGATLESSLGGKVDKVTGKGLSTNDYDDSEKSKVASASQDVTDIKAKIPSQATAQNQLADKDFVNSSIATATADFKGTYDSLSELQAVTADNNDYGYVVSTDQSGNTVYSRYKYNGSAWVFEYDLNNSSFTAAEWASIQSQITAALVQKLSALPTNQELVQSLSGKQDTIPDLSTIRSGANAGATAYQKPGSGIPASDMASGVIPEDVVKYAPQTITDAQKMQARTNIGAASEEELDAISRGEYVEAWDGVSEPVVANIPSGVQVEYNSQIFTGTLAASNDTLGKIYLVGTGSTDEYNRYRTSRSGVEGSYTYSWVPFGSTQINLANYATKSEVSQLKQEVNDIKPSLGEQIISANLYTSRYIDKDTGEMVSGAASSRVYEYTGIISGGVYYVSGYVGANTQTCLGAWYKEDGTFISSFVPSTGTATQYDDVEQTVPADAAILRVFGTNTVTAQVIEGIETRISSIDGDIINLNKRLDGIAYIPVSALRSYNSRYIDKDTGEVVSGASSSRVYEYTGIISGGVYYVSGYVGANTQTCLGAWYKEDGTFISSFVPSTGTATQYDDVEQTVPADAAILRVFGHATLKTPSLKLVTISIIGVLPCKNRGRSVGVFGGSLSVNSESQTAKNIWKKLLNVTVTDYGVGGAGFSSLQGTSIQSQVDGAAVHDVYILWASTNDYRNNRQCGTWEDYTVLDNYDEDKLTTQCGGINYCIKTLLEKNPKAEIYFFTPLRFFISEDGYNPFSEIKNSTGKNFAEYIAEMKKCCDYYGIPTLDQFDLQGVNIFNKSLYYKSDSLHMNEAGYAKIGWVQADFLANGE